MQRIVFWSTSSAAILVGAVTSTHLLGQAADEQHRHETAEYKLPENLPGPIVDTHELMELFNQPLYELLSQEMQKELGSQTEWETIADRGIQAAEVMNLVAIREQEKGNEETWLKMVREAQAAGLALNRAAMQQDPDATRAAYTALIGNCNDCHQTMAPDHAPQLRP